MQNEIILADTDPKTLIHNQLSLQRLKVGSTLALIAATQDKNS